MTVASVIAILSSTASGAADTPMSSASSRALGTDETRVSAPVYFQGGDADDSRRNRAFVNRPRCASAKRAVAYYAGRIAYWRSKMGAAGDGRGVSRRTDGCPRYLVHVLQRKAYAARRAYGRWVEYHYAWRSWLPAKWVRIAICETGLNWRHSNSSYEGAFGFAKSSWDSFKYRADRKAGPYPEDAWQATPRQQYEVALAIWRVYGFSGWGCRNA